MANHPIFYPTFHGDLTAVRNKLEANPELVQVRDAKNLTPLHVAASRGQADISRLLLEYGADVNVTDNDGKKFLTAASTDSHRMAISKTLLSDEINFDPIILPKKTIFQLCSLLDHYDGDIKISNLKSKIKFEFNNTILMSKLIDGKFPNYFQVIPKDNQKKLEIDLKPFLTSVDRVASVSLDKKDGLKMNLINNNLNLSVNNSNSGDGKESLSVKFDHELDISFNPRYLLDVASNMDGNKIEFYLKESGSPALIKDPSDFDSIYVIMPMKG